MAARRPSIDLLAREDFTQRAVGRFLLWILTVGRYIVIFTELIVIAGFITRVALDRNLTSVNEDLFEQKAILASYQPVEQRLWQLDEQFNLLSSIQSEQLEVSGLVEYFTQITPRDLRFERLSIDKTAVNISATAFSPGAFSAFLTSLQANSDFSDLILESVETGSPQDPSIGFHLSAEFESAVSRRALPVSTPSD